MKKMEETQQWQTDMAELAKIETDNLIVFFDNGQWLPFNNENWPFAEVKAWIKLPDLPIHLCNGYGIKDCPNCNAGSFDGVHCYDCGSKF